MRTDVIEKRWTGVTDGPRRDLRSATNGIMNRRNYTLMVLALRVSDADSVGRYSSV